MARKHRLRIAGVTQHVIQRGNNRSDIFNTTDDYEAFLVIVAFVLRKYPIDLHGYALMRNHVHLLMTPREPGAVPKTMQVIGLRYARYFNRAYHRTGALFEGRYRATLIDTDLYWLRCLRYVEMNPVRAGIVARPESYPWSSYAAHAFGARNRLITLHSLYQALGYDAAERQVCWRAVCAQEDAAGDLELFRKAVHLGGALGRVVIPDDALQDQPS